MRLAGREHQRQIDEPRDKIDAAEAGDGAADEMVGEQRPYRRPFQREVVAIPERGPRQHDEQQTDLEEERDVDQPADQLLTLASAPC